MELTYIVFLVLMLGTSVYVTLSFCTNRLKEFGEVSSILNILKLIIDKDYKSIQQSEGFTPNELQEYEIIIKLNKVSDIQQAMNFYNTHFSMLTEREQKEILELWNTL